jgi:hypothetical protein
LAFYLILYFFLQDIGLTDIAFVKSTYFVGLYIFSAYHLLVVKSASAGSILLVTVFLVSVFLNGVNHVSTFLGNQVALPAYTILLLGVLGCLKMSAVSIWMLKRILIISGIMLFIELMLGWQQSHITGNALYLTPLLVSDELLGRKRVEGLRFNVENALLILLIFYLAFIVSDRTMAAFYFVLLITYNRARIRKGNVINLLIILALKVWIIIRYFPSIAVQIFQDTRSFLFLEVKDNLNSIRDWIFGKGLDTTYYSHWFDSYAENVEAANRLAIEAGALGLVYRSGVLFTLIYLFFLLKLIKITLDRKLFLLLSIYFLIFLISAPLKFDAFNLVIFYLISITISHGNVDDYNGNFKFREYNQ